MELYRKVRLACRDGMSERAAARHFGVSRESVKKMLASPRPPEPLTTPWSSRKTRREPKDRHCAACPRPR